MAAEQIPIKTAIKVNKAKAFNRLNRLRSRLSAKANTARIAQSISPHSMANLEIMSGQFRFGPLTAGSRPDNLSDSIF